ncbi:hypothetical protein HRR81_008996 [Exophiala dermatitidis]|uniref:Uncharacterized protein n=1 Tax=Exophiala dermatitidis (strain ATCC 34100 / CBS 525.76 / NIH/UT8656) TaxID=858893 RepID=H6CC36_EXODN|nr:uncharacterized protein HMPREF1120_09267 [Exophiala dermatitidis NIH/UT8656]KAJ4503432.1 hypothetical protein HRR73_009057 [Exophiala dermatitidis]EHY61333.1 hypothetical protein HMPREF1120_09267 [Exophiala dermatitidis NIH/UT8656]KAJ4504034.1 hypothetical protein HRR74_009055 [Exophiala dermatitidis]KAJ4528980.1 hypothetical protein HRR76_009593 [Exophiala dermatitidis]KAJ4555896.1 hypothetical protein HRR79_008992 [Exophiala dermatitidis]
MQGTVIFEHCNTMLVPRWYPQVFHCLHCLHMFTAFNMTVTSLPYCFASSGLGRAAPTPFFHNSTEMRTSIGLLFLWHRVAIKKYPSARSRLKFDIRSPTCVGSGSSGSGTAFALPLFPSPFSPAFFEAIPYCCKSLIVGLFAIISSGVCCTLVFDVRQPPPLPP